MRDLLSGQLLDDLKAWNDSCDRTFHQKYEEVAEKEVLEQRGRELAIRTQGELGTEGWEVLYHWGGWVHRVYPPGTWPEKTWRQDLLGYAPRGRRRQQLAGGGVEVAARGLMPDRQQHGADGSTPHRALTGVPLAPLTPVASGTPRSLTKGR